MVALQENPCTDVQQAAAVASGGNSGIGATGATGGTGAQSSSGAPNSPGMTPASAGAAWVTEHVMRLKYQARVDKMNAMALARTTSAIQEQ